MGADLINSLDKWEYSEFLITQVPFIIFARGGYDISNIRKECLPKQCQILSTFVTNISSTEIRKRIAA